MQDLNELLRPLVEKAINGIDKGTEFVIEQAPDLLQEFYNWHIAELSIIVFLCLIGIVQVFWIKKPMERLSDDYERAGDFVRIIIQGIVAIVCFAHFFISLMQLIKILVAPKLYLIEYFIN